MSYSANRQTNRQTEIGDHVFRDLGTLKREDMQKSRSVIFSRIQYFYVVDVVVREVKSTENILLPYNLCK